MRDSVEGAILRVLAGYDQEKLEKAIKLIEDSVSEFKGHHRYSAKATYELVLGHLYTGNLSEARGALDKLTTLANSIEDKRWLCYSSILSSRIDLREATSASIARAKERAEFAIALAQKHGQLFCEIDALIAAGRAFVELRRPTDARERLKKAMQLNHRDGESRSRKPTIDASCALHLTKAFLMEENGDGAREAYRRWIEIEPDVDHQRLRSLAGRVKKELDDLVEDFRIRPSDSLKYIPHRDELQIDLLKFAEKDGAATAKKKAEVLDVSLTTIQKWEKKRRSRNG